MANNPLRICLQILDMILLAKTIYKKWKIQIFLIFKIWTFSFVKSSSTKGDEDSPNMAKPIQSF